MRLIRTALVVTACALLVGCKPPQDARREKESFATGLSSRDVHGSADLSNTQRADWVNFCRVRHTAAWAALYKHLRVARWDSDGTAAKHHADADDFCTCLVEVVEHRSSRMQVQMMRAMIAGQHFLHELDGKEAFHDFRELAGKHKMSAEDFDGVVKHTDRIMSDARSACSSKATGFRNAIW